MGRGGAAPATWILRRRTRFRYDVICLLYPVTGGPRDFARFYVLETVARVPYFAYLSVMHLRETFGEREPSDSERMRTHYAEADNELHHLLIMESLGGNSSAIDRGLAQTMAFFYYWYVTVVYAVSEPAACFGCADTPRTGSQRRRGCDLDIPWRRRGHDADVRSPQVPPLGAHRGPRL